MITKKENDVFLKFNYLFIYMNLPIPGINIFNIKQITDIHNGKIGIMVWKYVFVSLLLFDSVGTTSSGNMGKSENGWLPKDIDPNLSPLSMDRRLALDKTDALLDGVWSTYK